MLEKTMRKEMISSLDNRNIVLQPIESPTTGSGILDMFYRTWNNDGWVEFKCIKDYPKRINTYIVIPWRPGQLNWINKYRQFKGSVFLFLHIKDSLWIFKGFYIKDRYRSEDLIRICEYKAYWKEVDWFKVYNILNGKMFYY